MNISVRELLLLNSPNLIDIRERYKFLNDTIYGSVNISESELMFNTGKYLNKTDKYYIFCDYGNRSRRLCEFLNENGYMVYNIVGGYNAYNLEK